jgi:putative spermidine/putrescine transport system substrate-binding protein
MSGTPRRAFLRGVGASALAASLPAQAQTPKSITVTSFGGVWETSIREVVVPEFERRTKVNANVLLGGPPQWMAQIEANRSSPPIDILVNVPDLALVAGRSGLVDKVSVERAPNLADVPRSFIDLVDGYGSVFTYGCWGLCYHERLKNPPASLAEFIDGTAQGKWRAALPSMLGFAETAHVLIWSFADMLGGSIDNVDPAFAAIQRMKSNAVFWNGISDPLNLLESGDADISIYVDGRTWAAYDSGATWIRFINPKERGINLPSIVQKVKNGADIAWDYFDSMLSPTAQAKVAERLNYGVSNQKVQYSPKLRERITKWEQTRWPPFEKLTAETRRAWVERWGKEVRA